MRNRVIVLLLFLLLAFTGCTDENAAKITEEYSSLLAGKTFHNDGRMITFYEEGVATYDFRNGVGENHHYAYTVNVVSVTDTEINMLLTTVMTGSDNYHTEDYIDNGPEPATYSITNNTLDYYFEYDCLYDPNDAECYSNEFGRYNTVCAEDGCKMFIAPTGNTKYCVEHAGTCWHCDNFINPDEKFCAGCPKCIECGVDITPRSGKLCDACNKPTNNNSSYESNGGKCYMCNGTGFVKYYYGNSDLEAILNGHDPYWFGECTSCNGTGRD